MRLLDYIELAQRWGMNVNTLRQWKHTGKLPPPDVVLGGSPVWYEATIETMEDTHGALGGSENGSRHADQDTTT